jgi:hypothetical protein
MDATGEGDLQNYYDVIGDKQEAQLRPVLEKLLPVMFMSKFGQVPDDINFRFTSPRTPSEKDTAELVSKKASTIYDGYTAGIFSQQTALKELQIMGQTTGMFTSITDQDVALADDEVDQGDMAGMMPPGMPGAVPLGTPGAPPKGMPHRSHQRAPLKPNQQHPSQSHKCKRQ